MSRRSGRALNVVIVACAISAGVHAALVPDHLAEGTGAGLAFLGSAIVLAGLVAALTRRPGTAALIGTIALLAGLIGSYAAAITSGLPLLHPMPEPVEGLRRDRRTAVPDAQERPPVPAAGGDLDVASGPVVADRVVDQVAAQAFQQGRFTADRRGPQVGSHGETHPVEAVPGAYDHPIRRGSNEG